MPWFIARFARLSTLSETQCVSVSAAVIASWRSEPLAQIFADMKQGVTAPGKITFIDERRRAISLALDAARPGDCLLIAGKGHESYQEFADTVIPFDDRQVVRELIGVKLLKT